jgi:hypothetical protein
MFFIWDGVLRRQKGFSFHAAADDSKGSTRQCVCRVGMARVDHARRRRMFIARGLSAEDKQGKIVSFLTRGIKKGILKKSGNSNGMVCWIE